MITRAAWRKNEEYCPICRLWNAEVQRSWDDKGNFLDDRCLKCNSKLPHPRRKPGNLFGLGEEGGE